MKKKFYSAAVLAAMVSVGGWNISRSVNDSALSDVALANVEALAFTEFTPNGWTCFWNYSDDPSSSLFVIIVRCNDCYSTSATSASEASYCKH
jgi:hypothetical protein